MHPPALHTSDLPVALSSVPTLLVVGPGGHGGPRAPSLFSKLLNFEYRFFFNVGSSGEDGGFLEVGLVGKNSAAMEGEGEGGERRSDVVLVTITEGMVAVKKGWREKKGHGVASAGSEARRARGEGA